MRFPGYCLQNSSNLLIQVLEGASLGYAKGQARHARVPESETLNNPDRIDIPMPKNKQNKRQAKHRV